MSDSTVHALATTEINPEIFRSYDIRGIVDQDLTTETVYTIGLAIGAQMHEQQLSNAVVARDGRLSGPDLLHALAKGLLDSGINVTDIGAVPTPVLYFAAHFTPDQSGIMLTGSHNPANYNGIKLMLAGETFSGEKITALYQRIQQQKFTQGKGKYHETVVTAEYLRKVTDDIKLKQPLKVVVDCGNGVAGNTAPLLYEKLGCDVLPLYCEVDGNFPNHHPDPSVAKNLETLIATVQEQQADVGLAFDGDGDRLGVVTANGDILWPDQLMMLFAKQLLRESPGSEIIYDVKCSRALTQIIEEHGGQATMWKTGHSLIKAKIKETNAALAGEMSGHLFFNDRWFGYDDALYAGARLLEMLDKNHESLDEMADTLPQSVSTPELKIHVSEQEKFKLIEQLQQKNSFTNAKIITLDGLRVEYEYGWGLIRASNTTPCLILRFEANSKENLEVLKEKFRENLLAVATDLKLPF